MLNIHKILPKPLDFWASNYYAEVDTNACIGCCVCETKCQVGAVKIPAVKQIATVNLDRCIGCGVCVSVCLYHAISLQIIQCLIINIFFAEAENVKSITESWLTFL